MAAPGHPAQGRPDDHGQLSGAAGALSGPGGVEGGPGHPQPAEDERQVHHQGPPPGGRHSSAPRRLDQAPKVGFPVPFIQWLREEKYYNWAKDLLSQDYVAEFFDRDYLLDLLDRHYSGREKTHRKLYTVLSSSSGIRCTSPSGAGPSPSCRHSNRVKNNGPGAPRARDRCFPAPLRDYIKSCAAPSSPPPGCGRRGPRPQESARSPSAPRSGSAPPWRSPGRRKRR